MRKDNALTLRLRKGTQIVGCQIHSHDWNMETINETLHVNLGKYAKRYPNLSKYWFKSKIQFQRQKTTKLNLVRFMFWIHLFKKVFRHSHKWRMMKKIRYLVDDLSLRKENTVVSDLYFKISNFSVNGKLLPFSNTAWKVSKYGVFSGHYFPVLELNTEIYGVYLRIQSEYRKIRTRKNSVFEHFSRSAKF